MLRIRVLGPAVAAAVLAGGCAPPQSSDRSAAVKAMAGEISALTERVDKLEQTISGDEGTIMALQADMAGYSKATLDPAQRTYARLDANIGTFAVVLTDVRPFADGVRVRLNLGNLTSATFTTATLALKYGRRPPVDYSAWDAWKASLREKKESVTEKLLPNHWNPVQLVLPGIEPKDFGYLEVSMSTNMIQMY